MSRNSKPDAGRRTRGGRQPAALMRPGLAVLLGLGVSSLSPANEAEDAAEALGQLDQSYAYHGLRSGHGSAIVGGSSFGDAPDRAAGDRRPTSSSASVATPGGKLQILVVPQGNEGQGR